MIPFDRSTGWEWGGRWWWETKYKKQKKINKKKKHCEQRIARNRQPGNWKEQRRPESTSGNIFVDKVPLWSTHLWPVNMFAADGFKDDDLIQVSRCWSHRCHGYRQRSCNSSHVSNLTFSYILYINIYYIL